MSFKAAVIADTVSSAGARLTTLQLRYPRFIHAEFMTHRMFSRNASSSRAIPVKRLIGDVANDPAIPVSWGKNQPGMQARVEHNAPVIDPFTGESLPKEEAWGRARDAQIAWANAFDQAGYHKQVVNRRIENDGHINVVVTATEWTNFFKLRLHEDAQPEIHELARHMAVALAASTPKKSNRHLPYVTAVEVEAGYDYHKALGMLSAARCARVSYMTHEGKAPDFDQDMSLAARLLADEHMSPFEHAAEGLTEAQNWTHNFQGWCSYRAVLTSQVPSWLISST